MILTAKIAFEEIGNCDIARYVIKNLFTNLTAKKISELTKLKLSTVNYFRKQKFCIGDLKQITGYVYINFNHLEVLSKQFPGFNLYHYCILSMLHAHERKNFKISDERIKEKLNLSSIDIINEAKAFNINFKLSLADLNVLEKKNKAPQLSF